MKSVDVVVLTESRYIEPTERNAYIENVLLEDELVLEALRQKDLHAIRLSWDDPNFDWNTTRFVLFRTTWDYFDRFEEFSAWLLAIETKTILLNSSNIIRWNIDKHYLLDLERSGISIVPTYCIEKGNARTLQQIHEKIGWKKSVLKPCVSGAGRHTYKLDEFTISQHEHIYKQLISEESMLLQPFVESILTKGEISLMIINGTYTHAVLKKAKPGDFRVQDDFGGSVYPYEASLEEIQFAEKAINACPETPMYARVDVVWNNSGDLAISELELIEPELWFRLNTNAATKLAEGIALLF